MIPRLRRLRALILHRTPVREKDRVVEVFSREEGRLKLLAAGVRRFPSRRAGHLEPLMESALVVSSSSGGDSVRDARVLAAFPRLRENLGRLRTAYVIAQLLREGTGERLADARLYDAARALLGALDQPAMPASPLLLVSAEVHLLLHLGAFPDTRRCGRCRRTLQPERFAFDRKMLGFLCRQCAPALPVPPHLTDAVKLLRLLQSRPVPPARLRVSDDTLAAANDLLRALFRPLRVQVGLRLPSMGAARRSMITA